MLKICILGAGVNGICCALQILEYFQQQRKNISVTVISEHFTPNTTGDGSAGLWGPYLLGGTDNAKVYQWSKCMHDFLKKIWLSPDAGEAGVCLLPCIRLQVSKDATMDEFYADIVYGFGKLAPKQLAEYNDGRETKYNVGVSFVTYTSEPLKLLPYLMKRFTRVGGKIEQRKVTNLDEFVKQMPYNVFVNCTGLGSRSLLEDTKSYSVRGQVSRVKANWQLNAILDDSDACNYIIPNTESVVLGGTHQIGDYNINIDAGDKQFIRSGCEKFVPGLVHAQPLFDWVGLRPGRDELRLEAVQINNKLLIHNYGHGGSGVTLCWGCAQDVLELLLQHSGTLSSKL